MRLAQVIDLLRCPHCASPLDLADRTLRCARGHAFDLSRQGYANLSGAAQPAHADTAAMVAARDHLLRSGQFGPIAEAVVAAVPPRSRDLVDVGTGTGHYAAAVLDADPAARGLGLDVSVAACRRAARVHPRLGAVAADVWSGLPVATAVVDVLLSVFAPRNPDEFARVLRPGGTVITVTPTAEHLRELRAPFDLIGVEQDKQRRLADGLARAGIHRADSVVVSRCRPWSIDDAVHAVLMGPNAFHHDAADVRAAAGRLGWPRAVTVEAVVTRWRLAATG